MITTGQVGLLTTRTTSFVLIIDIGRNMCEGRNKWKVANQASNLSTVICDLNVNIHTIVKNLMYYIVFFLFHFFSHNYFSLFTQVSVYVFIISHPLTRSITWGALPYKSFLLYLVLLIFLYLFTWSKFTPVLFILLCTQIAAITTRTQAYTYKNLPTYLPINNPLFCFRYTNDAVKTISPLDEAWP